MRTATQTVWLLALLLTSCGDSSGGEATTDVQVCEEPPFVEGINPDWAPCGCGDSEWYDACYAAGGHTCVDDVGGGYTLGGTCTPLCSRDEDCPAYNGHRAECQSGIQCRIVCDGGCPDGMVCSKTNDGCIHNFPPK
jgi:hypothetical protein